MELDTLMVAIKQQWLRLPETDKVIQELRGLRNRLRDRAETAAANKCDDIEIRMLLAESHAIGRILDCFTTTDK